VDGHHLRVHGEGGVGLGSAAVAELLESSLLLFRAELVRLALLQLGLHVGEGRAVEGAAGNSSMLQCAAVESWAVVVVASTDDLTSTHDDTAVAVVERRFRGLLEAQRQIIVRLHFDG
jgi:hypothetical protein